MDNDLPASSVLFDQAVALHQQGRLAEARAAYERVLSTRPGHFDALHLSGVIAAQSGDHALAATLIRQAIDVNPGVAAAHVNLALSLEERGRTEEAVASYDRAIELRPDDVQALFNRGNALMELKRTRDALPNYDRAVSLAPNDAQAHCNRGNALLELERAGEALASYDRALALQPEHAGAHSNRGLALQELGCREDALACHDRALSIRPDHAQAHLNRGNVLLELHRAQEALDSYDRAIELRPDDAPTWSNRGNALLALHRVEEAVASHDRAIGLEPDHVDAHWNKSLALLLGGQFEPGWALHEWRWKRRTFAPFVRNFPSPPWLGGSSLRGTTILLHAEQGLGDTIQFSRYARLVKEMGARVLLEVPAALTGLLSTIEGVDAVIERGSPLPAFDHHCPLLSLPLAVGTRLATVPFPGPYLSCDPVKRDTWSSRLGPAHGPRVGLAWSGNPRHKNDHNRSVDLETWLKTLPEGFEYVSLQKELREQDRAAMATGRIRHFGEALQDFTDTAALCDVMDLVLSVDTSIAHLAGALGKTTGVLLPHAPDWRWLLDRDDSPWYASVRLFRQDRPGTWEPVLARAGADLQGLLERAQTRSMR